MTHAHWFCEQLSNSAASFAWAVEHTPQEHWHALPPKSYALGEWSLARHVFHLQYQERYVVHANLQSILSLSLDIGEHPEEQSAWQQEQRSVERLLQQFHTYRQSTIGLIEHISEDEWEKPREMTWWNKPLTLQWVVTKAWQHTLEHTHTLLRLQLFWDPATYRDAHPEHSPF